MQQVRDRAVSTRLPRAKPASPAQARSVSHGYATDELRVQKSPSDDATRRRMAQKSPYRAESAVLLRGAAGTSGAQKLVTRPTGRPEGGTTATGGAQCVEVVELGKSDVQWPAAYGCGCGVCAALASVNTHTSTVRSGIKMPTKAGWARRSA